MRQVTIIPGDGIGPEIMSGVLKVLDFANVKLSYDIVEAGLTSLQNCNELIPNNLYKSIEKNKIALKGPLTTPIGEGYKSINVTLRKKYDLYSNIRNVKSLPNIITSFKDIDLIIFRENTEDLYLGEESIKELDNDVEAVAIKRITYKKSYRIIKKAFEYAKDNNYSKVTCVHKANILKLTDGLFLKTAQEISLDYPNIELEDIIIDNMCMQLVTKPNDYNIIVTMNLYGDIISDLAAGLVGGLGVVPGANIGDNIAIFEAVHGSAPDIAGQNKANPLALLLSAINMLHYLDMNDEAIRIQTAIEKTLDEKQYLTTDLGSDASTTTFIDRIIFNLGG